MLKRWLTIFQSAEHLEEKQEGTDHAVDEDVPVEAVTTLKAPLSLAGVGTLWPPQSPRLQSRDTPSGGLGD